MQTHFTRAAALVAAVAGCATEDAVEPTCDTDVETCELAVAFEPVRMTAGGETDTLCITWDLNNDSELWVNRVEFENDGFYHHSNWFFVPEDDVGAAPSAAECSDIEFEELTAAVKGGVLFAQSTQNRAETQAFEPGAAIRLPPRARVVGNLHVLNLSDRSIETGIRMRLTTLPPPAVATVLAPFRIEYNDLHIPPQRTSTFAVTCDVGDYYARVIGEPLDMRIHYVLPHVHDLATGFEAYARGAERTELVYSSGGYAPGGWGRTLSPPVRLGGDSGLSALGLSCRYANPRAEEVGFGIGDQEMCVLFGFAESAMKWEGRVRLGDGTRLGPDDDGIVRHEGTCSMIGASL